MGDYATTTSISNLLPNWLKGNTTTSDAPGTSVFSTHITRAESLVNAAVSVRYSLPFIVGTTTTNVPPLLRTLSEDIACGYALRGSFAQDGASRNEYPESYFAALDMLKMIQSGQIVLTDTGGSVISTRANARIISSSENYTPVFGLDEPTDWQRDSDEIADQESARNG